MTPAKASRRAAVQAVGTSRRRRKARSFGWVHGHPRGQRFDIARDRDQTQ